MNRRTFNKLVSAGGLARFGSGLNLSAGQSSPAATEKREVKWPTETYRRLLIDMHVPDWDGLLANFDPADYVNTIARAGFQALMQYANSHVGLSLWRTAIGQMDAGMKGRDYFGEVMAECRRQGLHAIAYYSLIFDDWAYQEHPEWRILPEDGEDPIMFSRMGTVCPNSLYRDHALACLRELVKNYDFEAIFLDMTFWPAVCYCPYCTARFRQEHNKEPPRTVNWNDPLWRSFQNSREQWLLEFAKAITRTIKQTRSISVYHNFGPVFAPWQYGVPLEQREASDFCSGDFNGEPAKFSLICKTFGSLTPNRPFEVMTSRTTTLTDFETTKSPESLLIETLFATIHSSAYLLIDAIKPDGTLNHRAYEYMGQVSAQHEPYERFLGGEMLADVAIYYDKGSMYDPRQNGLRVAEAVSVEAYGGIRKNAFHLPRVDPPHMEAVLGATRILREAHIPFGVVTNATLDQLPQYRAAMLPSVLNMTAEQAERLREFVKDGGFLYVSGPSSLDQFDAIDSRLEDVLGVHSIKSCGAVQSYLTPTDSELLKVSWPQENITFPGRMVQAQALAGTEVLATVTLPFVEPERGYTIGTRFAQIWSNPPATTPGKDPGIVINSFGKGKTVWVAAPIESRTETVYARIVSHLIRRLLSGPYHFEVDTHPSVEMTLFQQAEKRRLLVSLLNAQVLTPTIPVGATVRVQLPAQCKPKRVLALPAQKEMLFKEAGPYVEFVIPPFKVLAMASVEYE
jgi:uncharacterized Zn-finger protein